MGFEDLSARLKKARKTDDPKEAGSKQQFDPQEGYRIRGKMLGVLLRDARVAAGRSFEDCADLLRVAPQIVEGWEYGDDVPNLPQLEILAYYLGVPVSHFWGQTTLEATRGNTSTAQAEYIAVRNRMVGLLLRMAREEQKLSLDALSATSNIPVDRLTQYEMGDLPIPMHELSVLGGNVKKNMNYFLESESRIGELLSQKEEWRHFTELPEDLRQFASNPRNMGFIEIAIMLSQMPTEKLRKVGESVLEITR